MIELIINAIDSASPTIEGVGSNLQKVGGQMTQLGTSLTLLTAPIDAFFGASLKAASDLDTSLAQLNQVIKSTGGVAGITSQAAQDMASSLSKVTRYDDDTIISGENLLLTFTNIGHTVFPQATQAILDVSTAMNQDLKSSAIQVGKALNDPTAGLTALTRIGVSFTEQQKEQIKTMQAAGNVAGAQAIILKELQREFGGSAEAAGNTFAGGLDKLRNKMQSLQETIGHLLMPILQRLVDFISPIIDKVSKWADENPQLAQTVILIAGAVAVLGPALVILGTIITSVGTVTTALGGILEGVALGPIALVVAAVVGLYLAFQNNFLGIRDFLQPILDTIGKGLGAVKDAIDVFIGRFREGGLREAVHGFFAVFEDGSSTIGSLLKAFGMNPETADSIAQWFSDAFMKVKPILDAVIGFVETFVKNFSSNLQLVPFYVTYYFNAIRDTITTVFTNIGTFIQDKFLTPLQQIGILIGVWLQPVVNWFQVNIPLAIAAVQQALKDVQTFLQNLWAAVEPTVDPIIDWFNTAAQKIIGFFAPVFATIQDIINKATLAIGLVAQLTNANNGGIVGSITGATGGGGDTGPTMLQQLIADLTNSSHNNNSLLQQISNIGQDVGGLASQAARTLVETTGAGPGGLPPVTGTAAYGIYGGYQGGSRDNGGAGAAGMTYLIGTGAQPEVFTAPANGTFTPNGGSGGSGAGGGVRSIGNIQAVFPGVTNQTNAEQFTKLLDDYMRELLQ